MTPNEKQINRPIAVFDSGVGGVSVLRELRRMMPYEQFLYYGDSANAPYGEKTPSWILDRVTTCVTEITTYSPKALVVACNTATGVAISTLRAAFTAFPIIGIEPSVKPAAEQFPGGNVAVLATPVTLEQRKFANLLQKYSDKAHFYPLPCPGLAEAVEKEEDVRPLLTTLFTQTKIPTPNALVLGCTHYPLIKEEIQAVCQKLFCRTLPILDGGPGTARQTQRLLEAAGTLAPATQCGSVTVINTAGSAMEALTTKLLAKNEKNGD